MSAWAVARRLVAELDALADRERRAGIDTATPEYLDLNARVDAAVRALPWWQRARAPMELANLIRP